MVVETHAPQCIMKYDNNEMTKRILYAYVPVMFGPLERGGPCRLNTITVMRITRRGCVYKGEGGNYTLW